MIRFLAGGLKAGLRQPYLAACRRSRRVVKPLMLNYSVTWRCNARCIMCDNWKTDELDPEIANRDLSTEEVRAIFKRDAPFLANVCKMGLTGGELFLRDDIPAIIWVLHQAMPQARISVVTNGLMTKRILTQLAEIKTFYPGLVVSVSIDGLPETHNQMRGLPGAYAKSMATIEGARSLGFPVTSGLTVSPLNYDQIRQVAATMAELGVDFSCNLQDRGASFNNNEMAGQDLEPEQRQEVIAVLNQFPHHYYMDNLRRQMEGESRTLPCYSGFTSYFISPNGDVLPCNLIGRPLGNLRRDSLEDIAGSERAWRIRDDIKNCSCWSQCEVKNAATSAPWSVAGWLAKNPRRMAFFKHYLKRSNQLWV